ncbi:hypothetical protein A3D00_04310 [Candidatus Woesebacteria bacterium RIFCSPHIGHO2_02_FULL_38_9]|uniref:Uncharacterized protein n=1 Tax=Candidatus Woesebacteria bacterium RIFCSPHIGHO2_01_FULL_39_28 TaxID=1802496 RepID=A0A1F7YCW3_9BACT|nr:MAG: hypothetical protein A2627_00185 [Candidatus Woesebacteria bacterium RIFCSPHIGHO2_01_FULL_39_28]OGM32392.1 MAG: hypothetical protein A3D00_04310 [Candidatus Woesebacteria bacterium RIFCSPHIGHO2_02_FULL_38_9]OGM57889.1 MAG: hypothetical protein A3A50_04615 [Candidatus Woesebacteria bacterium RIFCSPLOWO2_01_FULL_38_20]
MKKLLDFIVKNITGSKDFEIEESTLENQFNFTLKIKPEFMGLIIGKEGRNIKNIRNLVKVKAVLENKSTNISVTEVIPS